MGAPRKHDRVQLLENFLKYIAESTVPIVSKFAYQNGLNRTSVYEIPELADAIKLCIAKKEAALEEGALTGTLNCSMAIFSLKQIGWKDTQTVTNDVTVRPGTKLADTCTVEEAQAAYLFLIKGG
jgi:hypothetical protein